MSAWDILSALNYEVLMSILFATLIAWTMSCWFTELLPEPFLGLRLFSLSPLLPLVLLIIATVTLMSMRIKQHGFRQLQAMFGNWLKKYRQMLIILLLISVVFIIFQVPTSFNYAAVNNADSGVYGITGYHIIDGKERPMWLYGKHFHGMLVPHLTAGVHAVFGKHPAHLRIVNQVLYLGFIFVLFLTVFRVAGIRAATIAGLLAALPVHYINYNFGISDMTVVWLLGGLLLLLTIEMERKQRYSWQRFLWLGFFAGLGFWVWQLTIYFIAATCVGLYFGWLAMAYDDLIAPMIAHGLYDFIALTYVQQRAKRD